MLGKEFILFNKSNRQFAQDEIICLDLRTMRLRQFASFSFHIIQNKLPWLFGAIKEFPSPSSTVKPRGGVTVDG